MKKDKLIDRYSSIFLDFDGVVKDSVEVKSYAFEQLFLDFGKELAEKVRKHHEANGGMSRFNKFPVYFSWAGLESTQDLISEYSDRFSQLVVQKVIDADWVDGIEKYLQEHHDNRQIFIVTATPQLEIEEILKRLEIFHYFKQVIGSPTEKIEAIKGLLKRYNINPTEAIMVGDSISDYEAADGNNIAFMLRCTSLNKKIQYQLKCKMIKNFL